MIGSIAHQIYIDKLLGYRTLVLFMLICTYFVVKELEKLNDTKSRKKSDEFAKNFGDWLKYESVCFPEHKDKSIEELLEIYKNEKK